MSEIDKASDRLAFHGSVLATPTGLAELIHSALSADDPFANIEPLGLADRTVVDGKFDLERVAKRILNELEKSKHRRTLRQWQHQRQ